MVRVALCTAVVLAGCHRAGDEPSSARVPPPADSPTDSSPEQQPRRAPDQPQAAVVFDADGEVRVSVEVARSPRQIQRGLMYRQHLPPDSGMLFVFSREKVQSFWMKNTLIPLDMIFVTAEMEVAGVVENAQPETITSRTIGKPSQFVVEVNSGFARKHNIAAGTRVRFENVQPL